MNPVVVIPTFVTGARRRSELRCIVGNYDHTTNINEDGELERCLTSLEGVKHLGLVIILVAADRGIEAEAVAKVRKLTSLHPDVSTLVIGNVELGIVRQRMEQLGITEVNQEIGLRGYSAVRNLGLVVANALGFDAAVFLDDDEVIDDPDFMRKAVYGLGKLTKKGVPILAKTGYYINDQGSYYSKWEDRWYNRFWQQGGAFNDWIRQAMQGPRLSRSNHVCGGCLAIHKEAYRRLAFDPWIPRGEDLDYMLNLRMYGSDIWFDNKWQLRHLPPKTKHEGQRFRQDIFRWLYEHDKLEYSHSLIDLLRITPQSLRPYPGPFLERGLQRRIAITAFLRSMVRPDKKAYRRAAKEAMGEAKRYAEQHCSNYFEFQRTWPQIMERIQSDKMLTNALVQSALLGQEPVLEVSEGAADAAASVEDAAQPELQVPGRDTQVDPGMTTQIQLDLNDA